MTSNPEVITIRLIPGLLAAAPKRGNDKKLANGYCLISLKLCTEAESICLRATVFSIAGMATCPGGDSEVERGTWGKIENRRYAMKKLVQLDELLAEVEGQGQNAAEVFVDPTQLYILDDDAREDDPSSEDRDDSGENDSVEVNPGEED